jgi:DNA invertase Pin-like site-specific DNA recombinase
VDIWKARSDNQPYIDYFSFRQTKSQMPNFSYFPFLNAKGINIYAVKGGWELNSSIQSKVVAMAFSIAAEIERDFISKRTKEALRVRKAQGIKLRRPQGTR